MKQYLIIGGSSGIGKDLCQILLEEGHDVIATYNSSKPEVDSQHICFQPLDVEEESPDFSWMPAHLDGIIYCPGNISLKPFEKVKPKEFIDDYNLQVMGAIKCIQAALPALKKSPQASIVLFSTIAVKVGFNFHSIVSASKGAIEGLCRSLAAEYAPNIRVNCIAPSLTDTPLAQRILRTDAQKNNQAQNHPLKRIGESLDIAKAAHYLLTDNSSWITGQILHIDGGLSTVRI